MTKFCCSWLAQIHVYYNKKLPVLQDTMTMTTLCPTTRTGTSTRQKCPCINTGVLLHILHSLVPRLLPVFQCCTLEILGGAWGRGYILHRFLENVGVDGSNSIDSMGPNDGKVSHVDPLLWLLLNNGQVTYAVHVPRPLCTYLLFYFFLLGGCLLYTSPSPRDATLSRMPSSA